MQLLAVGRSGEACEFACTLPQRLVPASQRSDASASGPCARAPCFMLLESPAAVSCPSNGHMLRIALCGLKHRYVQVMDPAASRSSTYHQQTAEAASY